MKKIAIYLYNSPNSGGVYQYIQTIINVLKRNGNYQVVGLCLNNEWVRWCRKNEIEYIIFRNEPEKNYLWKLYKKVRVPSKKVIQWTHTNCTQSGKLLKKKKIDIIICPDQIEILPFLIPTICVVHDLMHIYERKFPEVGDAYESRQVEFKGIALGADIILTDSQLGIKQFKDNYGKYGGKAKIYALPYIAPTHIYHAEEKSIELPDKFIFYPAQFWKHKNHINLLKALLLVSKEHPDIHLVLVGSAKNGIGDVDKFIRQNDLQEKVTVLGFVQNEEVIFIYRRATALVMPTYFGPTNIPPLEAVQLGCPVAISGIYGMPKQLGDAALYFHPDKPEEIAECILRLWTDEKLRKELIEKGFRKTRKWGEQQFSDKLLKILDKYS